VLPTLLVSCVTPSKACVVTRTVHRLAQDLKTLAGAFCVEQLFPIYVHRHSNLGAAFPEAKCWLETDSRSARLA
jgi:hypothetical protein